MSATKTTFLAALALLLTFAGGFLAGAFAHRAMGMRMRMHGPRTAPAMLIHHLDLRLDLTDAQRAQIERIVEKRHERMRTEIEAVNGEIERVLTPEQRRIFATMRLRPGGGPPGGMHRDPH